MTGIVQINNRCNMFNRKQTHKGPENPSCDRLLDHSLDHFSWTCLVGWHCKIRNTERIYFAGGRNKLPNGLITKQSKNVQSIYVLDCNQQFIGNGLCWSWIEWRVRFMKTVNKSLCFLWYCRTGNPQQWWYTLDKNVIVAKEKTLQD